MLTAEEQAQIQKVMDSLKLEVDKRDTEIRNLQRSLKEAETILVILIFCSYCLRLHCNTFPAYPIHSLSNLIMLSLSTKCTCSRFAIITYYLPSFIAYKALVSF